MTGDADKPEPAAIPLEAATRTCPICKKPAVADFRPFCSKRCADIDLGRWFNGSYAVPAEPDDDEAERVDSQPGRED